MKNKNKSPKSIDLLKLYRNIFLTFNAIAFIAYKKKIIIYGKIAALEKIRRKPVKNYKEILLTYYGIKILQTKLLVFI